MTNVSPDEIVWLALALVGIGQQIAGLRAYWRGVPADADERRVRHMGIVSSLVHLLVKSVFAVGAVLAMSQPWPALSDTQRTLFYLWRAGIVLVLVALDAETIYLRWNRRRLTWARHLIGP